MGVDIHILVLLGFLSITAYNYKKLGDSQKASIVFEERKIKIKGVRGEVIIPVNDILEMEEREDGLLLITKRKQYLIPNSVKELEYLKKLIKENF